MNPKASSWWRCVFVSAMLVWIGCGAEEPRAIPQALGTASQPLSGSPAIQASTWFHSLALRADGSVWAWGSNSHGKLGDGTTTHRLQPVQVLWG